MLDEKITIPQAQQWKVIKALYETTHYGCEALWKLLQRLWVKEWKCWWPRLPNHVTHVYKIILEQCHPLLHYLDPFNTEEITWFQFSSVAQLCPTLCDPMNCSIPGLPVYHQLQEFTQTHVHWVGDAIQPSHPLSSPSPPVLKLSQHQGLFKWVNSSHQVDKGLEFQLQHQSFQWTPRTGLL